MRPKSEEDVEAAAVRIELPAAEGRLMSEPVARDSGPRNLYVARRGRKLHGRMSWMHSNSGWVASQGAFDRVQDLGAESVDGDR